MTSGPGAREEVSPTAKFNGGNSPRLCEKKRPFSYAFPTKRS